MKRTKLKDRVLPTYTKGEEIFNMVSHIVGGALGVITTILAIVIGAAWQHAEIQVQEIRRKVTRIHQRKRKSSMENPRDHIQNFSKMQLFQFLKKKDIL